MFIFLGLILLIISSASVYSLERSNKEVDVLVAPHSYNDSETDDTFQRILISETDYNLPSSPEFLSYSMECSSWNITKFVDNQFVYTTQADFDENNLPVNLVEVVCISEIRVDKTSTEKEDELDFWHNKTLFDIDRINTQRGNSPDRIPVRDGGVSSRP